jgi:uncharacterized protein YegL
MSGRRFLVRIVSAVRRKFAYPHALGPLKLISASLLSWFTLGEFDEILPDGATEATGGFNSFLEDQQKQPGRAILTLVLFDHEYIVAQDGCPVQEVQKLDANSYQPRGTTALLDAIGRTIMTIGERLDHTPEQQRPDKVLVVILTDGLENASKDFSLKQINQMIQHQQEVYSWEFQFLAAGQDAIQAATNLGISADNAVYFDHTPQGVTMAFQTISAHILVRSRHPLPSLRGDDQAFQGSDADCTAQMKNRLKMS